MSLAMLSGAVGIALLTWVGCDILEAINPESSLGHGFPLAAGVGSVFVLPALPFY